MSHHKAPATSALLTALLVLASSSSAHADAPSIQFTQPGINDATAGVPETGSAAASAAIASASVDPATGIATASVPLSYPKARGAAQPRVAIGYSSVAGQGFLGWGWSLSFPVIERTTLSGPPTYNDHLDESLPSDDRFSFQGQPLVPICRLGSGCQDRSTAAPPGSWLFRLENDTLHARFWWLPDSVSWLVQLPSGETLEMGIPLGPDWGNLGENAIDVDPSQGAARRPIYRWYVSRQYDSQRDESGAPTNPIVYAWIKADVGRRSSPRSYLQDVFDTMAPGAPAEGFPTFAHHLRFTYEPPSAAIDTGVVDPPIWHSAPALRLKAVDVTSVDFGGALPRQELRRYHFAYDEWNDRSYLRTVTTEGRCDSPAPENTAWELPPVTSCTPLPPTQFSYLLPPTVPEIVSIRGSVPDNATILDINGDGVPDFLGTADGSWQPVALNGTGVAPDVVLQSSMALPQNIFVDATSFSPVTTPDAFAAGVARSDGQINAVWSATNPFAYCCVWDVGCPYQNQGGSINFPACLAACPSGKNQETQSLMSPAPSNGIPAWQWLSGPSNTLPGSVSTLNTCDDSLNGSSMYTLTAERPIAMVDIDGDGLMDEVTAAELVSGKVEADDYVTCGAYDPACNCTEPAGTTICYMGSISEVDAYFSVHSTVMLPNGNTTPFGRTSPSGVPGPSQVGPKDAYIASIAHVDQWPYLSRAFYEDMNGDGLADLVVVYPPGYPFNNIGYMPGQGTGAVGLCPGGGYACSNNDRLDPAQIVWMTNTPEIPASYDGGGDNYLYAHDINGDGLADLLLVDRNRTSLDVYLNLNGKSYGSKTVLDIPGFQYGISRIMFADMNGSGVDDIVVINGNEALYVDLLSGQRPGLLLAIDNGRDATTTLTYASTVDLARCSRGASGCTGPLDGKAWQSDTPQVIHVVTKMTTTNNLPAPLAVNAVTEYSYSDPVYDGRDRSFRGFRRVRQARTSDPVEADDPPVTTETTFLVGRCQEDDPNGTCPPFEIDRPFGAVTGLPVVVDTYDGQGHYTSTVHTTYTVNTVAAGADGRVSRFAYPSDVETYAYDPSAISAVPRTQTADNVVFQGGGRATGTFTEHEVYANQRSHTRQLAVTSLQDANGNLTDRTDLGERGVDPPIHSSTVWVNLGDWMWRPVSRHLDPSSDPALSDEPRDVTFHYDASGNVTEIDTAVYGTFQLLRQNPTGTGIAPAPKPVTTSVTQTFVYNDHYGSPNFIRIGEAGGAASGASPPRCTGITYDSAFKQLPVQQEVFTGSVPGEPCAGNAITTNRWFDRGFEKVVLEIAPDGAQTRLAYEAFGRLKTVLKPDPVSGAPADQNSPSETMDYVDSATSPQLAHTSEWDGTGYRDSWKYTDGLGNALFTAHVADPAAGDAGSWVVSGAKHLSGKGTVLGQYVPFFWNAPGSTGSAGALYPLQSGFPSAATATTFDAFGNIVDKYDTSGTLIQHRATHALSVDVWDGEELPGGRHDGAYVTVTRDGHGRTTSILKRERIGGQWVNVTTSKEYTSAGQVGIIRQTDGTHSVQRTVLYDSLGHMVANHEPNGTQSGIRGWAYAYDATGSLVGTSDPRGCGENIAYDAVGRVLSEDFSPCAAGQQPYTSPSGQDGTESYFVYDDASPLPTGRLLEALDRGADTMFGYDLRNRVTDTRRRLAKPGPTDSHVATRYSDHWFERQTSYDDVDRPTVEGTGADVPALGGSASSSVITVFSARGTVETVLSIYGFLVRSATYDADGLARSRVYGDATNTTAMMDYDGARRLSHMSVKRTAPGQIADLTDLAYSYDAMGNPVVIYDGADGTAWPSGARPRAATSMDYDDAYRIAHSVVIYSSGTDGWTSPVQPEVASGDTTILPIVGAANRINQQDFTYDWLGNMQSSSDDAGVFWDRSLGTITNNPPGGAGPNQIVAAALPGASGGTLSATYDPAGNLATLTLRRSGSCNAPEGCSHSFAYTWDEVGQLAEAQRWDGQANLQPSPGGLPNVDIQYVYDAGGHRVLRGVTANGADPVYTAEIFPTLRLEQAAWQGSDYERTPQTESVYLVSNGTSLARLSAVSSTTNLGVTWSYQLLFELADPLGSTSFVIDQDSGKLVERITYQPYGATEADYRPDGFREPYRFTGKEDDREVGLTYFGARYYSPALGRWVSPDPKTIHQLAGDLNPYAYVGGSTLSAIDPDGMGPGTAGEMPPDEFDPTTGLGTTTQGQVAMYTVSTIYQNVYAVPGLGLALDTTQYLSSLDWSNPGWDQLLYSYSAGAANTIYSTTLNSQANLAFGPLSGKITSQFPSEIVEPPPSTSTNGLSMLAYAGGSITGAGLLTGGAGIASEMRAVQSAESLESFGQLAAGGCFVSGTPVLTTRGPEPIESVRPGDTVVTRDIDGRLGAHAVVRTFEHVATDVVDLEILDPSGTDEHLLVTSEHPFWVESRGWVEASALGTGDELWTPTGASVVEGRQDVPGSAVVHNFEVEGVHNYLVGAASTLVHNNCAAEGAQAIVSEGKFGYLFGEASGNAHNVSRSLQNASQLSRVGVYNDPSGRALLQSHFNDVVGDSSNIVHSYSDQYGNFQIRESLFAGPGGFVKFESTWQVLEGGSYRFTTAIPFGGP